MIKLDGMLMIGSAGANVGKTELACAVVRKFGKKSQNIIGIKVTTIKEKDGQCPRGGDGCGACSSLDGAYSITEETESSSGKDTSRLLAAGAGRVFWIRALKAHLKEATTALLDIIGPDAVSICESNSLRLVVEPGLFLIAEKANQQQWKASALQVRSYADKIVVSDGTSFDLDINRLRLTGKRWTLQAQATAIIVAGGASRRMGADKATLPIKGRPMIQVICEQLDACFEQILISAADADKFSFLGYDVVRDKVPDQGPLMGIASALEASKNEVNFVIACDIPEVRAGAVRRLLAEADNSQADIILAGTEERQSEPLFAVYRKSALGAIDQVLSSGGRRISDVFELCEVKHVKLGASLMNLNTVADYEEFRKNGENSRNISTP